VDEPPVIRLFRFKPARPEFDQTLRTTMLPDLRKLPGLVDVHVGRHGPEDSDRIVVSVWTDRGSMVAGVGESLTKPVFHPDRLADTTDRILEVHPLEVDLRFDLAAPATILRVFRGTVKSGELALYVEDARAGTLADAAAERGPNALYLASVPPDRFITVSLWPSWSAIETATGGDVHRPIVTRDPRRIVGMDVVHYEVVPEAI
jgi:heme-degrading monooxygenase HmoA